MTLAFFIIALVYSMVGFGGGSSYIAILALGNTPYELIPIISLCCNLIVVTCGTQLFRRRGHLEISQAFPYVISSVPMSFIGGMIPISRDTFLMTLGCTLMVAGIRLLFYKGYKIDQTKSHKTYSPILIGAILGFLSGLVGIGGGIFLSPTLLLLGYANPKKVAGIASFFIFINSLSGLAGQILKSEMSLSFINFWPLFVAVFIGGQFGSRLTTGKHIKGKLIKNLTAILVIAVSMRLLFFS